MNRAAHLPSATDWQTLACIGAHSVDESKMTVIMIQDLPVSRADIEAVSADVGAAENPPEGLIVHVAIETAEGVRIIDI
jgi:hypothetical protein